MRGFPLLLTREDIASLKRRALRHKVWHTLSKLERSVIDLAIKCVEKVRSYVLAREILRIAKKVREAVSKFAKEVYEKGFLLARQMASIAVKFGNEKAAQWVEEPSYIKCMGLLYMALRRALIIA